MFCFFFKQKTAYEMRISDWSSDVCSSDLLLVNQEGFLCESLSSNVFIWYDKKLYTPAISEGCIDGVMRKVVIDLAVDSGMEVIEAQISPNILREADRKRVV